MSTIKRKVFRVLIWIAIIAGIGGTLVSALIGVNAFRVHFAPLTPYYIPNGTESARLGTPMLMTYDGYIYNFNVLMNINLMFPNGTVIASNTSASAWPLGLYANSNNFAILDISLDYPQSAINWSKTNNQPLLLFSVVEVWFNLPLGGQNIIITPVTIYNIYPIHPQ
jgi:hypothetical protein